MKKTDLSLSEQSSNGPLPEIELNGVSYRVARHNATDVKKATYYILLNSDDEEIYYQTPTGAAELQELEIRRKGFGSAVDEYTFDKYLTQQTFQEQVKNRALEYVSKPEGWFVVMGVAGCGKSHISTAIAVDLMRKGNSLEYMKWMNSINDIKYNMDRNAKFIKTCTRCDILYIDDFLKTRGNTEPTDIEIELAFQILDKRYTQKKITIISTEKSIDQIRSYDLALSRRIIEMSGSNLISLGNDIRRNVSEHGLDGKKRELLK